jgi:hypothetical protein
MDTAEVGLWHGTCPINQYEIFQDRRFEGLNETKLILLDLELRFQRNSNHLRIS